MYHIAICDDEKEFIREITNLLRRYEKESGKKFGEMEFNYKKQVEHLLVDEFSYALNETPELSKERLYRAMA